MLYLFICDSISVLLVEISISNRTKYGRQLSPHSITNFQIFFCWLVYLSVCACSSITNSRRVCGCGIIGRDSVWIQRWMLASLTAISYALHRQFHFIQMNGSYRFGAEREKLRGREGVNPLIFVIITSGFNLRCDLMATKWIIDVIAIDIWIWNMRWCW